MNQEDDCWTLGIGHDSSVLSSTEIIHHNNWIYIDFGGDFRLCYWHWAVWLSAVSIVIADIWRRYSIVGAAVIRIMEVFGLQLAIPLALCDYLLFGDTEIVELHLVTLNPPPRFRSGNTAVISTLLSGVFWTIKTNYRGCYRSSVSLQHTLHD